jgi:hypothetical protein
MISAKQWAVAFLPVVILAVMAMPAGADLVAYYQFEDGTGPDDNSTLVTDVSGSGHDGTINRRFGVLADATWTEADGGAPGFGRGLGLYQGGAVQLGTWDPGESFTLTAWVNWERSTNALHMLISKRDGYASSVMRWQWSVREDNGPLDPRDELRMEWSGPSTNTLVETAIPDVWQHYAVTSEANAGSDGIKEVWKLYIDGVLQELREGGTEYEKASQGPLDVPMQIGAIEAPKTNQWLNGIIDEVSIWDETLTQEQIQDIMMNGALPPACDLLGDMNDDGDVNGLDVAPFVDAVVLGPYDPCADMNEDDQVNGLDVDPFVAAVVGGPETQAVPEPSTWCLLIAAVFGLAGYRWRRS